MKYENSKSFFRKRISMKMYPLKQEAKFFNSCVEELLEQGDGVSDATHFCNGGKK